MPGGLRPGELLAGAGGAALLASLFTSWYSTASAWEAFAVVDLLLALVALAGIAVLVAQATRRSPTLPTALAVVSSVVGALAVAIVVWRLLDHPGGSDVAVAGGAWLGLAGAAAVAAGGWWSMADESPRRVADPPVQARPAPPAEG